MTNVTVTQFEFEFVYILNSDTNSELHFSLIMILTLISNTVIYFYDVKSDLVPQCKYRLTSL